MRLDKFLKLSRLIKRRTVASDACSAGRVQINGNVAKPAAQVKVGDILTIGFGAKTVKCRILKISEIVKKDEASEMYEYISSEKLELDE